MMQMVMHTMTHMATKRQSPPKTTSKAITVRIPEADYEQLKKYAASRNVSLNSMVAEAIAQYQTKIERQHAISQIEAFQAQLRDGRREGSDSVEILRDVRQTRAKQVLLEDDSGTGLGAVGGTDKRHGGAKA